MNYRGEGWQLIEQEDEHRQAIFPSDEELRHDIFSDVCLCNVRAYRLSNQWVVYKHQAFDRREVDEWLATRKH